MNTEDMSQRSKNTPDAVGFTMTVERVEATEEQRDQLAEGMRILATWLLRHHRKTVRAPKDKAE